MSNTHNSMTTENWTHDHMTFLTVNGLWKKPVKY